MTSSAMELGTQLIVITIALIPLLKLNTGDNWRKWNNNSKKDLKEQRLRV